MCCFQLCDYQFENAGLFVFCDINNDGMRCFGLVLSYQNKINQFLILSFSFFIPEQP